MPTPDDPRHLISNLILPAAVQLRLTGSSREEVLRELVQRVPDLADKAADQERLYHALLEREHLHSTGIGDGLALPHTRDALGGLVQRATIVFGRHPAGIAFGAIDGKPVRLFFLLVTTSVTQHLQILARISRLLRDARVREALLTAPTPERTIAALRQAELGG